MNNLMTGVQLTVLGMGLVFFLLGMLWALMALMVRLDRAEPEAAAAPEPAAPADAGSAPGSDHAKRAAIVAAVMRYRAEQAQGGHAHHEPPGHWLEIGRTRQQQSTGARRRT